MIDKGALFQLAKALDGVPVLGCLAGTPAALAGIHYGDILLSVNGQPTRSWGDYLDAKALRADGMQIVVFRDGREHAEELIYNTDRGAVDPLSLLGELVGMRVLPGEIQGPDPAS